MEAYDKERSRAVRRRIRSVLMEQWDPIGVKNAPEAGDEYDGYIGSIFDLINRNATVLEIEEYLRGPNNATWNWDFLKTGRCCA